MICRAACVLALAIAACDPVSAPIDDVTGEATMSLTLVTPKPLPDGETALWKIAESPAGSVAPAPMGPPPARFVPDLRGAYLVELWTSDGVADDLLERFDVEVAGIPPVAAISVPMVASIGSTVVADGSASASAEHRTLTYEWRLIDRPQGSTATLTSAGATASLVPDVGGPYTIGLRVFDGELWSPDGVATALSAQ